MGGGVSTCALSNDELNQFTSKTVFSRSEIRTLWHHFMVISSSQPHINKEQFQAALLIADTVLMDRIFRIFDANKDNHISFSEYLFCLSVLSTTASSEEKYKLSFKIYDFDEDDKIGEDDLMTMLAGANDFNDLKPSVEAQLTAGFLLTLCPYTILQDTLHEPTLREHDLNISTEDLKAIVKSTLAGAHCSQPNFINYEEYKRLVSSQPHMLAHLTLNISRLISKYGAKTGMTFLSPRA